MGHPSDTGFTQVEWGAYFNILGKHPVSGAAHYMEGINKIGLHRMELECPLPSPHVPHYFTQKINVFPNFHAGFGDFGQNAPTPVSTAPLAIQHRREGLFHFLNIVTVMRVFLF